MLQTMGTRLSATAISPPANLPSGHFTTTNFLPRQFAACCTIGRHTNMNVHGIVNFWWKTCRKVFLRHTKKILSTPSYPFYSTVSLEKAERNDTLTFSRQTLIGWSGVCSFKIGLHNLENGEKRRTKGFFTHVFFKYS